MKPRGVPILNEGLNSSDRKYQNGDPRWITAKNPLNANSAALLASGCRPRPNRIPKIPRGRSSNSDYRDLLDTLQHEAGVHYSKVDGDLQGRGYIVGLEKVKLLLVEHETGLEVLYIAGSIASSFGLIPLILQRWAAIRGRFPGRHAQFGGPVEIRRVDNAGHLQEEHLHSRQFSASFFHIGTFA